MINEEHDGINGRTSFTLMKNVGGTTIPKLTPVYFAEAQTKDVDMKAIAAAGNVGMMIGYLLDETLANEFGKVQIYGRVNGVAVLSVTDIVIGDELKLRAADYATLTRAGVAGDLPRPITALSGVTIDTITVVDVFLRLA